MIKERAFPLFVGLSLGAPVFFTKNMSLFRGGVDDPEFSLPLSLFVFSTCSLIALKSVMGTFLSGKFNIVLYITTLLYFYVFTMSLVMSFGDVLLLLLYFAPMLLSLIVAKYFANNNFDYTLTFKCFALSASVFAFLHVISSVLEFGIVGSFAVRGSDSIFGIFSIYQKLIYYSTVLSFASIASLYLFRGWVRWILFFALFVNILMCGAREAIIISVAAFLVAGASSAKDILIRLLVGSLGIISMGLFFFNLFELTIEDVTFLNKIFSMFSGGDVEKLTGGRSDSIEVVLKEFNLGLELFLFGSGFVTSIADAMTPHNQYIEWYLRGGIVFVLVNIGVMIFAVTRNSSWGRRGFFGVTLLLVLIVSNNVNTPFRAPYTSIFLWFIIGLVLFKQSERRVKNNHQITGLHGANCI